MAYQPKRTRLTQINSLFGSLAELPINQLPLGRDICQFISKCKQDQENQGCIYNGQFYSVSDIINKDGGVADQVGGWDWIDSNGITRNGI